MLVVEALDKCHKLRADLAEAFTRATSAEERFAISEAMELVSAARRALLRAGPDSGPPGPVRDRPPEAVDDAILVIEEPPPHGASMSAVDTTYAPPGDGTAPAAGDAPHPTGPSASGAPSVDRLVPADWLDQAR